MNKKLMGVMALGLLCGLMLMTNQHEVHAAITSSGDEATTTYRQIYRDAANTNTNEIILRNWASNKECRILPEDIGGYTLSKDDN